MFVTAFLRKQTFKMASSLIRTNYAVHENDVFDLIFSEGEIDILRSVSNNERLSEVTV